MMELLSPAGGMEQLKAALHFGADAVYGGVKRFGLRANAGNFTWEELEEALRLVHGLGKKFYLTLNILPYDDEMDGMVEEDFKLTGQGLEQMKALGIKTDFDLRHVGQDVLEGEHYCYDAIQYEHVFSDAGEAAVRKLFADLADPANYPGYLHCTFGADRTGTMCYLLLGLLGVGDEDLKRDYELTAMYYGYVSPAQMDAFLAKVAALPGETTQARVEYFLTTAGVTQAQMESIRQIFLG